MVEGLTGKALVLGGTGFIGSHLVAALVRAGLTVFSVSRRLPNVKDRQIGVVYNSFDLVNSDSISDVIDDDFNYVINLSGPIGHASFFAGGSDIFDNHTRSLRNVVSSINRSALIRFVQIGSSDEYGFDAPAPVSERAVCKPSSPYSLAKFANSNLLEMLAAHDNFPAVILRPFLVYGPGQDTQRFLPFVITSCLQNASFELSHCSQIRDFCFVEDIVDAIILTLGNESVNGEIINVGSGLPQNLKEIVETVTNKIGAGCPVYGGFEKPHQERKVLYADTVKARQLLGWRPKVSFNFGLEKTIDWYRGQQ